MDPKNGVRNGPTMPSKNLIEVILKNSTTGEGGKESGGMERGKKLKRKNGKRFTTSKPPLL